jgi:CRP-like cAMP-binding protein
LAEELSQFIVKAKAGDVLFKEGDGGDSMYFIHNGKVRIEKKIEGKAEILAVLEKGDFFGEMAILDHTPRTASAVVEADAELLKVDSANFEKLLKTNIEIAIRMIRKYVERLKETNSKLQNLLQDRNELSQGVAEIIKSVKQKPEAKSGTIPEMPLAELTGSSGSFPILKSPFLIGRMDEAANIHPDLDLTSADTNRSVSRRHAQIIYEDGQYFLMEEVGVSNGTFLGGEKLKAGTPVELKDGVKMRFGNVEFSFKRS